MRDENWQQYLEENMNRLSTANQVILTNPHNADVIDSLAYSCYRELKAKDNPQ